MDGVVQDRRRGLQGQPRRAVDSCRGCAERCGVTHGYRDRCVVAGQKLVRLDGSGADFQEVMAREPPVVCL